MRTKFFLFVVLISISGFAVGQSQDKIKERIKKLSTNMVLEDDSATRRYIKIYLSNPQKTANIIQKSYRYFPAITDSLEKHQLPEALRYLTMALTEFNQKTVSEDGGSGLWQMKYIPAKNYGIRITSYVDYRRDYLLETSATIQYLNDLRKEFNDWRLCVLAYYSDRYEVQKAIKKAGSDNFAAIQAQMPAKYKHIIPKFTAAAYVFSHASSYSLPKGNVKELPKLGKVTVEKWSTLYQISQAIGTPVELLEEANPIFKKGVIPHASYTYDIQIPANKVDRFYELGEKVYTFPTHAAEDGEVNPIQQAKTVQPKGTGTTANKPAKTAPANGRKLVYYKVRKGDVLGKIADLYDVRVSDLRRWNGIRGDRINIGQKLKVYVRASRYSYYAKINKMSSSQQAKIRAKD